MAITLDKLAEMVENGFSEVRSEIRNKIDNLESRMASKFDIVDIELKSIREDVREIRNELQRNKIDPNEFEDLMGRVKYLEVKLGIESGK